MYSLVQSKRVRGSAGEPLPTVFSSFEAVGTRIARGQLTLIAAGPGTGKTVFALKMALFTKVPVLYFSADSDAFTQLTRSISMLTGNTTTASKRMVLENDLDEVEAKLQLPVWFNYEASPTLDTIEAEVAAYHELYGEYPALIVVDNITNVRIGGGDDDDPFSGLEGLMDYLNDMARKTGSAVIGLHHVNATYNDADKPIPLSGVKGQIGRVPSLILTLYKPGPDRIGVSVVKDRGGKFDPGGSMVIELEFNGDRMLLKDPGPDVPAPFEETEQPEIDDPFEAVQSSTEEADTYTADSGGSFAMFD